MRDHSPAATQRRFRRFFARRLGWLRRCGAGCSDFSGRTAASCGGGSALGGAGSGLWLSWPVALREWVPGVLRRGWEYVYGGTDKVGESHCGGL